MRLRDKKHTLCLFILIMLYLFTPLSYINSKKIVSFKATFPNEEMLMIPSGIQHLSSAYSSKKPFFTLKPVPKHIHFILNTLLIIECFIFTLFIRAIINKCKLIHEHCVVKFHGSKYKSFLPSF